MKRHLAVLVTLLSIALFASPARAQAPPPLLARPPLTEESITPLPLEPIPDNPPPYEGKLFKFPYRIESPDHLYVEVLESLPGRPITGEHLVCPDGKISLGYYGEIEVAGLTITQAKAKIILHLRIHLTDQTLGLVSYFERGDRPIEPPPIPGAIPPGLDAVPDIDAPDIGAPPEGPKQEAGNRAEKPATVIPIMAGPPAPVLAAHGGNYLGVAPENSSRVYVDVAAYNSSIYYALGHFGSPGRLPYTGNETVLDAINFAGGIQNVAGAQLYLHRPERGGKPRRDYKIDLAAIYRGEKTANLQIFPNDRLVAYTPEEEKKLDIRIVGK